VNGKDTGGDGNGYKLGDDTASVPHILINCVAKTIKSMDLPATVIRRKLYCKTAPVRVTEENCLTDLTMQYLNNNLKFDAQKRCLEMRHLFLSSQIFIADIILCWICWTWIVRADWIFWMWAVAQGILRSFCFDRWPDARITAIDIAPGMIEMHGQI